VFQNGEADWTNCEILQIDKAFAILQAHTNNTTLLKLGPGLRTGLTGDHLSFWREHTVDLAVADNDTVSGNIRIGNIRISDAAFADGNDVLTTIIHEIGHNWDEPNENSFITRFRDLSGWRDASILYLNDDDKQPSLDGKWLYNDTASFAGHFVTHSGALTEYGRTDPFEDFATCFAAVLRDTFSCPDDKRGLINEFLNSITT
jgi:hypothetical protein